MIDLLASGRVRDPVHGYVAFTGLERAMLDHRAAQRLRYVAQSGLAHLVFPEVRTSRFSHSLGAMHLASRFFAAVLRNAGEALQARLEESMHAAVGELAGGLRRPDAGSVLAVFGDQGLQSAPFVRDSYRADALLVEQGLRLAALVHDLGHLPYSHDFEYALEQLLREDGGRHAADFPTLASEQRLAIHERIGYRLAELLMYEVFGEILDSPNGKAVEVVFGFARKILSEAPPEPPGRPRDTVQALYQWLHTIIAGELDVDRCDYILRDTRHYGLEFVSYDIDRAADHLTVAQPDDESDALVLAMRPQGQSAVESFLIARYRMYEWAIRHHKVVQAAAALRTSIRTLLRDALEQSTTAAPSPLRRFLIDIEAVAAAVEAEEFVVDHAEVLQRFYGYDDVWWTMRMREAIETGAHADDPWLKLVCFRTPGPQSLWKRKLDFPGDLRSFNERLRRAIGDEEVEHRWGTTVAALEARGVLVVRHKFKPWERVDREDPESESAFCLLHPDEGLVPISRVSPLVRSLLDAWMNDVQLHAFAREPELVTGEELLAELPLPDDDGHPNIDQEETDG